MAKAGPRASAEKATEVKARLIEASVRVLARDGFAHASARAIATEADAVNGLIFYHFGSMDGLLAATARALTQRGTERVRDSLGGEAAPAEWPSRLAAVIRAEAESDDGRAVMELLVGARTSPVLEAEVRSAIEDALGFATAEVRRALADSPINAVVPVDLVAELAAAAFLGLTVLSQNGRRLDLERLAESVETLLHALSP